MSNSYPDTLVLSSRVLRVLTKLNLLMGALIMVLLIASLVAEGPVMRALGVRPASFQFNAVPRNAPDHGPRNLRRSRRALRTHTAADDRRYGRHRESFRGGERCAPARRSLGHCWRLS